MPSCCWCFIQSICTDVISLFQFAALIEHHIVGPLSWYSHTLSDHGWGFLAAVHPCSDRVQPSLLSQIGLVISIIWDDLQLMQLVWVYRLSTISHLTLHFFGLQQVDWMNDIRWWDIRRTYTQTKISCFIVMNRCLSHIFRKCLKIVEGEKNNHLPQKETHQCDVSDVLGSHNIKHAVSSVWKHWLQRKPVERRKCMWSDLHTEYLKYAMNRFNLGFDQGTVDADITVKL